MGPAVHALAAALPWRLCSMSFDANQLTAPSIALQQKNC